MALSLSLISLLFLASSVLAQSACYWKPDAPIEDLDYVPCGTGDGFFACCHLSDICLEQAACYSPNYNMTYISGCTDPSYEDGSCGAKSCAFNTTAGYQIQGIARPCDDSTWICCNGPGQQVSDPDETDPDSCPCSSNAGTAITSATALPQTASLPEYHNGQVVLISYDGDGNPVSYSSEKVQSISIPTTLPTSTSATTSKGTSLTSSITSFEHIKSVTSTASSTSGKSSAHPVSTTPAATSAAPEPAPQDSNLGLKIGLPIGLIAAAAILGALGFFLYRRRRGARGSVAPYTYSGVGGDDKSTAVWQGDVSNNGQAPATTEFYGTSEKPPTGPSPMGSPPTESGFTHGASPLTESSELDGSSAPDGRSGRSGPSELRA